MKRGRRRLLVGAAAVSLLLGVAAIVIHPRQDFVPAPGAERELVAQLRRLRGAIRGYRIDHHGQSPDARIEAQLTTYCDEFGDRGGACGPYLESPRFPESPVNGLASVRVADEMPGEPDGTTGWIFDRTTSEFRANAPGSSPGGRPWFRF